MSPALDDAEEGGGEVQAVRIHCEERGSGELALVFLHYWGGSSRTWKHVIEPLAAAYHTITVDHRGWGESDAPKVGYTLADLADDAIGVIERLDVARYVLVGHSMGGKVAQLLASRRPKGLIGLALVNSAAPSPLALPAPAREMMVAAYSTRDSVEQTIDQVLTAKALSAADREQVITDSLSGAPEAKRAWPASMSQEDISAEVAAIDVPILVIAGELDRVDTLEAVNSELMPRLPGSVLHVVPGTGHLSPLESPEVLVRLIDQFAAGLG